jgi:hypothetical protein
MPVRKEAAAEVAAVERRTPLAGAAILAAAAAISAAGAAILAAAAISAVAGILAVVFAVVAERISAERAASAADQR